MAEILLDFLGVVFWLLWGGLVLACVHRFYEAWRYPYRPSWQVPEPPPLPGVHQPPRERRGRALPPPKKP